MDNLKDNILQYLKHGHENAIGKSQLQQRLQLKDDREMRQAIKELRHEGHPIGLSLSKPHGYYIIETKDELHQCMKTFKSYCCEAAITRRDLKLAVPALSKEIREAEYLEKHPGQLSLKF